MTKNKISISVAGNEFVVSTEEEREYTIRLAEIVDRKIRALRSGSSMPALGIAAILCALDLCDENEKNKASCARLRDEIRQYLLQLEEATADQERLQRENRLLKEQLAQYEAGQIGFTT